MSKYIIDTEAGTCVPAVEKPSDKMVQFFQANRGVKEYTGVVETIQRWYYGHLVKAAWCATSLCYAARVMAGLSGFPKKDNVYELYMALKTSTYGVMIDRPAIKNIRRGDILFFLVMAGLSGFPKKDNVYELYMALKTSTYGVMIDRPAIKNIRRGDILFFLWDGNTMTAGSSKHVGLAEYNADYDTTQNVFCVGGNQSDKICTAAYSQSQIYAIFRLY